MRQLMSRAAGHGEPAAGRPHRAGRGQGGRVAAGSELETVQDLRIDEILPRYTGGYQRAAGIHAIGVGGDLDHVQVDIHAARPGLAFGHGGAEVDRLRDELEELTGKPVQLNILEEPSPAKGRKKYR